MSEKVDWKSLSEIRFFKIREQQQEIEELKRELARVYRETGFTMGRASKLIERLQRKSA